MSGKGQKHLCKNAVEATTTLEKNSTDAQNVLQKNKSPSKRKGLNKKNKRRLTQSQKLSSSTRIRSSAD